MNLKQKQRIKKWAKALRSGKFQQTQNRLFRNKENAESTELPSGYCCLGVARNIFKDSSCPLHANEGGGRITDGTFQRAFGFGVDMQNTLIRKNDDGVTFTEIADYLDGLTKE